jgi:CHASE2 domain-containing sensor protein
MQLSRIRRGYIKHILSWRFLVTLIVIFALDFWLERTVVAQRATLGGFDTASERAEKRDAQHTAVVAISALEVEEYFHGRRPIPPASLDSVVTRLLRLKPRVLVIDIFTDDSAYRSPALNNATLFNERRRLVWAQFVDTASFEVLPILGGVDNPPGRPGLASILTDEDRLVRRFRPRYLASGTGPRADTIESLPLAAANAFTNERNRLTSRLPSDTGSIAIRKYDRDPPFYLLDDLLSTEAALTTNPNPVLSDRVVVLGFIDGSDQVLTPDGVRTGPEVVADAIETLLDDRGAIVGFPHWLEWVVKLGLALFIAYIHYKLPPRPAAISMIVLAVGVVYAAFFIFEHLGYWTNFILIVVGIWIEQLYENVTHSPQHVREV